MFTTKTTVIAASLVLFGGSLATTSALAVTDDNKSVAAAACVPYAPTTMADLTYSPTGIYNPGTLLEKVVCPLPRDQDSAYVAGSVSYAVYYRVIGGAPSRMTCTLWVGSTSMQSTAYSFTASGSLVSGGTRTAFYMDPTGTIQPLFSSVPSTMLCVIPPKTSFAGIFQEETGTTNTP